MAIEAFVRAKPQGTEQAQTQAALRESEELYHYVVELSSLLPWIADRNGGVVSAGERWVEWTGAPLADALGDGWTRFVHPDDRDQTVAAWAAAIRTSTHYEGEWRLRMKDGSYQWRQGRAAKRIDAPGDDVVWYGMLDDVHEQRVATAAFQRSQAQLAHVSQLSAMGTMAAAIAHDLNQPLTAIAHYVRGSKRLLDEVDGVGKAMLADALDGADKSAVRASDIVRRVREFVSRGTIDARREDLAALIEDASRFALIDARARGIRYLAEFEHDCPVIADRVQIQQVLVNVIGNAIDAMEGAPRRELTIRTCPNGPGFCQVEIRDTGPGIPPEAADRIFDPLFTTSKDGMGVGLSISRTIVEAHGGKIWHEAAPGGGAVIAFTLPVAPSTDQ